MISLACVNMEITIKIDERSEQAKAFYEYLKSLPFVEIEEQRFNKDTEEAIKEAKSGETTITTLEDFRKSLYS